MSVKPKTSRLGSRRPEVSAAATPVPLQLRLRPLEVIKSLMAFREDGHFRRSGSSGERSLYLFTFSSVSSLFGRLHFLSACRKWKIRPSLCERLRIHHLPVTASPWKPVERGDRREDRIWAFWPFISFLQAKSCFFSIIQHINHSCTDGPYFAVVGKEAVHYDLIIATLQARAHGVSTWFVEQLWSSK